MAFCGLVGINPAVARRAVLMLGFLRRCSTPALRQCAVQSLRSFGSATESAIEAKLHKALTVKDVNVRDTSGGCGTMFEIRVTAEEFRSKSIVQQHKIVTKALQSDISQWHGFTLLTSSPKQ